MTEFVSAPRAYFGAQSSIFANESTNAILGKLVSHHGFAVESAQRDAWIFEIDHLKGLALALQSAFIFLELSIPRMGKRADAIVVVGGIIFVIEYKVGASEYTEHAIEQAL